MNLLLKISLILLMPALTNAQKSDIVVLKKHNKTVQTLFSGMPAKFQTINGNWVNGNIRFIANDSIYINYFDIRVVPNGFGGGVYDTVAIIPIQMHYQDIHAFPRKNNKLRFIKNGTLLKIGGAGYILLNLFNGGFLKESVGNNDNITRLIIAGGVLGTGFLLGELHKDILVIGRRYKVNYVKLTD